MTALWTPNELAAWRPPERLTVSEWADRHRYLDSKTSAEPGKYSSARNPYAREWMDSANCRWVRQVTIIAGTQLGKTETLNNVLGFMIHQDPGPAMVVMPRNPDVRLATQRRIMPMILGSPVLKNELTEAEHDVKNVEIAFRRAILYVRSSQSPADLASVPVRLVLADEVDKYPKWAGDEAAPLDLARERQKTFWNRLAYVTTTPTTRDATGWGEYEDGDRRHYHVPCPHCDGFQVLDWQQIRYPDGLAVRDVERDAEAAGVRYFCAHCGAAIPDAAKPGMLDRGVWVPERSTLEEWLDGGRSEDREPHRSFHLTSLYSPWLRWGDMVAQWLKSKDRPERLQNWVNSWLAEPWEDKVEAPTEDLVTRAVVAGWTMGQIPEGVLVATAGADVQKDGIWVVVRGWGWDGESWLLFADKVDDFESLEDVLFRNEWTPATAKQRGIRAAFIDSRHRRSECIEFVRRRPTVKMAQGVDRTSALDFTSQKLEKHPTTGQPLKHSVMVWSLTVSRFKDMHAENMRSPSWHVPEDVSDDYARQATAEHKVRKRVRNRERDIWVLKPGSKANHLLDCEVYATAAGKLIQVDRLRRRGAAEQDAGTPGTPPKPPRPPLRRRPLPDFPRLHKG